MTAGARDESNLWAAALSAPGLDDDGDDDVSEETIRRLLETALQPMMELQRANATELRGAFKRIDEMKDELSRVSRVVDDVEKHNNMLMGDGSGASIPFAIKMLTERVDTIEKSRVENAKARGRSRVTVIGHVIASLTAVVVASFAMCGGL